MSYSFLGDSRRLKENGLRGCGQHRLDSATYASSSPRLASLLSLRPCGFSAGAVGLSEAGILYSGSQPNWLSSGGRDHLPEVL